MRVAFVLVSAVLCAAGSVAAQADTFSWSFASANVSGSGTLTADPYGMPGRYLITGGTGTVTDTTYGTITVTLPPCADPTATCTLVNTDNAGANLTYDDLLFPDQAPGAELDDNGLVLTPGFDGTHAIGIFDSPSKEFYEFPMNGYQDLTTPFTVIRTTAVTPEPSTMALLGTGLLGAAGMLRRRWRS